MKKILFFIAFAALPFVAAVGANLPSGGGYSGPYIYEEEAGYGYLEGDAVYDESAVTFDRNRGGFSIVILGYAATQNVDCDYYGSTPCNYCEGEVAEDCDSYDACLDAVKANGCGHINSTLYPASSCPLHKSELAGGGLTCPVSGNAALMFIFALPYGIARLYRKKKKSNNIISLKI